jgi:hypothetical protein
MVRCEAVAKTVEPFCYCFTGRAGQRLRPRVNFDARNDAMAREDLRKWRPTGAPLAYRFVIHDYAADGLLYARRGE